VSRVIGYGHAGGIAVDFFFLLSGFLVTGSILSRGLLNYSVSRFLRLFPALWVYLIVVVFLVGPLLSNLSISTYFQNEQTWMYLLRLGGGYATEWFLPGVFENNKLKGVNGSIWSVILEVRMYLWLAFFYVLSVFRSRLIFNFFAFFLVVLVWFGLVGVPGVSGSTDNHMALLFLLGAVLYVNRDLIEVSPLFILTGFSLAAITHGTDKFQYAYILLLVSAFLTMAFLKNASWMDKFGDYSYGVYLWGWPVQQILAVVFPDASPTENALSAMLLALLLAIFSWHFVEKPALKLKDAVCGFFMQFSARFQRV
jgi:peptidoglycan/LPS O-acetylase OafA/YrhL